MLKSKKFLMVLGFLLIALIVAGCSSNDDKDESENDSADGDQVEIDFWHIYSDGPMSELLPELLDEFEKENPDIAVNDLGTNFFDYFTKLNTSMAGGTGPDLAMNDTTTLPVRAKNGAIVNIDKFIEEDGFNTDDFYPVLMDKMNHDGSFYGLPSDTDVRLLFYNKEHFREAGLDPDSPPTNWAELEEYAKKLTIKDENDLLKQMGFSPQIGISNLHIHTLAWTNGGDFWDEEGNPTFTKEENLEALQFMKRINDYYGENALSAFKSQASALDYSPFVEGTISMVVDVNNLYQDIKRYNPELDFGVAAIPYEKEPVTYSAGFDYEIIDNGDDEEARAAWELLKFLTSEETQIKVHEELGNLVSNINAAEAPQFMEDPIWASIVEQMEYARFIEFIDVLPGWNSTTDSAEEAVLTSDVDPEKALEDAQEVAENAVENQ